MNNEDLKENLINTHANEEKPGKENRNNKESTQLEKNDNINENFPDIEKTLISSMKIEMARQKESLSQCQSKLNELYQENSKLKLLQLDFSKKLSVKEDIINSNKVEISRLQSKNNILEIENDSKKKTIQELKYKNIELTQKIESLENMNKISQKIKENEPKNIENNYLVELGELYNKINEIEIKNAKLNFDNKNLLDKIEVEKNDKKNEIEILESLHKKKIENLEKNILSLNNTINELINENKKQPKEVDYHQIQNEIYQSFSELDQKIKKYDNDNFLYKKENQKLKNENEELKIIINGKENIINKLQSNISKIENDFKIKLSELNSNYKSPMNNKNNMNELLDNNFNSNENFENLLNEQKRLTEENEILKNNYEQMTLGINKANELFVNRQKEYENIINVQNDKLKEYKFKISLLKIKINELHSEINFLKDRQGRTQSNFYQPPNDNLLSTIEKDQQQSIDFNFTPEQIKLFNSYNTPVNNPKSNLNYRINNLKTNENNIK